MGPNYEIEAAHTCTQDSASILLEQTARNSLKLGPNSANVPPAEK